MDQTKCTHATLTVNSAGVERTVCEKCGSVSFTFQGNGTLASGISRDMFSRDADREVDLAFAVS
jgi:hypothetical protein